MFRQCKPLKRSSGRVQQSSFVLLFHRCSCREQAIFPLHLTLQCTFSMSDTIFVFETFEFVDQYFQLFFFFFLILYNDFLMPDKTMTMITILLAFHLDGQQPLLLWISIVLSENIILCIYTIIRATIQDLKFKMLVFWGRNLSNFIGLVQHLIGVWMLLQVAV